MEPGWEGLEELLDGCVRRLHRRERASSVIDDLCVGLNELREKLGATLWPEAVARCREHALRALLHEDPYTRRAFEKPRGYAGDAIMLDYIYAGAVPENTSEIGRRVFVGTTASSNARSVVARRDHIADLVGRLAEKPKPASVLALACGHLREADVLSSWQHLLAYYAVDQDPESVELVATRLRGTPVKAMLGSVKSILAGESRFEQLSLVYASGLYDYLPGPVASRLTSALFKMLAPGGQLLLANFTPDSAGRGYMEAFMDWQLIYRNEAELVACLDEIPSTEISNKHVYRDDLGNVVYLRVERRK